MLRIVSLIASASEIVSSLGLSRYQVGRSHECDFPPEILALPICTSPAFPTDGSSAEIDQRVKERVASALSVYEVSREKVFGEQHLSRTALELTKVDSASFEGHATLGQTADLLDRDEDITTFDTNDSTHDRGVWIVTKARDQVLDASNLVAVRVVDRAPQERREMEDFRHSQS